MFYKEKLIELMNEKKWTAYRLCKEANMTQSTLSDILSGRRKNPTAATLQKLANALGVSIDEFFKEDNTETSTIEGNEDINSLEIIPEEFKDPEDARIYVKKHKIFASEGFNADKLTDEEILSFANALLEQMRLVSYKYKK